MRLVSIPFPVVFYYTSHSLVFRIRVVDYIAKDFRLYLIFKRLQFHFHYSRHRPDFAFICSSDCCVQSNFWSLSLRFRLKEFCWRIECFFQLYLTDIYPFRLNIFDVFRCLNSFSFSNVNPFLCSRFTPLSIDSITFILLAFCFKPILPVVLSNFLKAFAVSDNEFPITSRSSFAMYCRRWLTDLVLNTASVSKRNVKKNRIRRISLSKNRVDFKSSRHCVDYPNFVLRFFRV